MERSLPTMPYDVKKRIADLHREIQLRDEKIEELEAELKIKETIIKRQVIMLSEK